MDKSLTFFREKKEEIVVRDDVLARDEMISSGLSGRQNRESENVSRFVQESCCRCRISLCY